MQTRTSSFTAKKNALFSMEKTNKKQRSLEKKTKLKTKMQEVDEMKKDLSMPSVNYLVQQPHFQKEVAELLNKTNPILQGRFDLGD